jgi:hypothetical protein
MVSNALDMELQDLLEALKRIRKSCRTDLDYKEIRSALPKDWPM